MESTLTDRVLGGRYEVGPLLGRGGMADVYDAVDTRLNRAVAVKVLRPGMASRPDVRRRFEDEARAAASLTHPNVVAVFDTGEDDGLPWIVMERLSGETLAARLVPGQPVETDWVVQLAGDVLGALALAHARGIVHRDVKPGNILLGDDGCAKVADFGIAKSVESVGDSTTAGMLLGTPRYLSPERVDGAPSTAASDIYSLGVVLYEALSGRRAYEGDTPVSVAYKVQHAPPPPLAELRPDLPPALVKLVDTAMARDPADRFATAKEMLVALERVRGRDDTVTLSTPLPLGETDDADATVAVARTAYQAGSPDPTAMAAVGSAAEARRGHVDPRTVVVLSVAALMIVLLAVLAINQDSSGQRVGEAANSEAASTAPTSAETAAIRAAADRLADGDGPKGTEAAERLRAIADKMDAGQDAAGDATSLLTDATGWRESGELGVTAYQLVVDAVGKVPGVDVNAAIAAAAPPEEDKGKGKGKKDDDRDD